MSLYSGLKRVAKPFLKFFFRCRVSGCPKKLPDGPLIVCANHISFFDPLFLAAFLDRPISFMAKKELFAKPLLKKILRKCNVIPLSRDGGDAAMLRLAVRGVKEGNVFALFPQGKRYHCPCRETESKGGVGMMVMLTGAAVLPVGIYAKNYRVRFFRRTNLCFGEVKQYQAPETANRHDKVRAISDMIFADIAELAEKAEAQNPS